MRLPAEIVGRLRRRLEGAAVCVTGGAGFIGGHLLDALLSVGATVTVLDDLSNSTAEHVAELIDLDPDRVRFVHGSVLDDEAVEEALAGGAGRTAAAVVFHLAAVGSVQKSIENPQRAWSVNATGTVRVLEAARRLGVRRFVNAASSSAYGGVASDAPANERPHARTEHESPSPLSPYAASKVAAETAVQAWSRSFGLSGVSLRYFNIFGPRQPSDSGYAAVIPAFARRLLAGEPVSIQGDGAQSRDFTYVANAVLATLLAGASEREFHGEVVNIGTATRTTVLELARKMAELCGVPHLEPRFEAARTGDVRHSLADVSRARDLLGYEPAVGFAEGLGETVAWYRSVFAGASDA
ncbi:MAG: NAD-dependent epimerase/dehydratase family protein [Phycisphaeraceae bacterium]|nr:NAD-dependent epimerase/dehydratase family protein [Phycisphaeraceae bacterium]